MRDRFSTMLPVSVVDGQSEAVGINVPRPMTEAEWKRMHLILRRMKPALVEQEPMDSGSGAPVV